MGEHLNYSPLDLSQALGMGPFSLDVEHDAGVVLRTKFSIGYSQKGISALLGPLPLPLCISYVEQIDHQSPNTYATALAVCFEELMELEVPARAKAIRILISRVMLMRSHLGYFYRISKIAGQEAIANHCLRERERFHDLMEMLCGSRAGFGAICVGGVYSDATDGWLFKLEKAMDCLQLFLPEFIESLLEQPIFSSRVRGLGVVSPGLARKHQLSGANLRSSGIDPSGLYTHLAISSSVNKSRLQTATFGDVYSRIWSRVLEVEGAIESTRAELLSLPSGGHRTRVALGANLGVGHACCEVEGPRGNVFVAVDQHDDKRGKRISFFNGTRASISLFENATKGVATEDLMLTVASFDPSFSEADL